MNNSDISLHSDLPVVYESKQIADDVYTFSKGLKLYLEHPDTHKMGLI